MNKHWPFLLMLLGGVCQSACSSNVIEPRGDETISAVAAQSSAQRLLKESGKSGELIMALPGWIVRSVGTDGSHRFNTPSWVFYFRDIAGTSTTSIEVTVSGDGVQASTPVAKISQISFPQEMAGEFKAINDWKLDNTEAEDIIRKAGGVPEDRTFMIKMRDVDGDFLPVWILPYRFRDGTERGVRADDGALVFLLQNQEDKWTSTAPR